MSDSLQPLIHKAPVHGLLVHVGRCGLCIGDPAALHLLEDGQIGIFAQVRRRVLGRRLSQLGHLGPAGAKLLRPALERGAPLRVRIVGLTPEHLADHLAGPEVHISVWGNAAGMGSVA